MTETGKLRQSLVCTIKINMPPKPFREEGLKKQKPFGLTNNQRKLAKRLNPILEQVILNSYRNIEI